MTSELTEMKEDAGTARTHTLAGALLLVVVTMIIYSPAFQVLVRGCIAGVTNCLLKKSELRDRAIFGLDHFCLLCLFTVLQG